MHRRLDGKLECPCGHPKHRRFSRSKLLALCRAKNGHPPPETTKYNDFPEDTLPETELPSLTPLPSSRHSRISTSSKALRASRIVRTKKRVLNDDALSTGSYRRTRSSDYPIFLSSESDDSETDDTPVATGSGSQESTSHAPTDAQAHPGPSITPNQPKKRAEELDRKSIIVDLKKVKNDMKDNSTNHWQPPFQLEGAGPGTTTSSSHTYLVHGVGRSIHHGSTSHDQAPASSSVGNPQEDQGCNTQSSGLPSRSIIPSSLSETDALVVSFSCAYQCV